MMRYEGLERGSDEISCSMGDKGEGGQDWVEGGGREGEKGGDYPLKFELGLVRPVRAKWQSRWRCSDPSL
jgi:hypothetical protein